MSPWMYWEYVGWDGHKGYRHVMTISALAPVETADWIAAETWYKGTFGTQLLRGLYNVFTRKYDGPIVVVRMMS